MKPMPTMTSTVRAIIHRSGLRIAEKIEPNNMMFLLSHDRAHK
ncbi:Hypothetical protein A7982_03903 [Minicystis rosea]|nr:Hypothetical protein A7982_03903 [Minicystis rosea]